MVCAPVRRDNTQAIQCRPCFTGYLVLKIGYLRIVVQVFLLFISGCHKIFQVFSPEHISQLVSMYKHETTRSQQMILQIIHQVALHYPAKVFGCYPHLTDDTKFPVTSLKNRAPILAALTQHSEVNREFFLHL